MGAKMKSEKNSLVLLSSKRTKADTKTRADEAFALPSFSETKPIFEKELPFRPCKEVAMEYCLERDVETLKQIMLKHEAMFREQVRELHRLYQVQRLLMAESKRNDLALLTYPIRSPSKSSLVSTLNLNLSKSSGERNYLQAVSGPLNTFLQDYTEFASNSKQLTKVPGHIHANSGDFGNVQSRKLVRRTIDLERPAEEYMDDDEQEKLEEETAFRMSFRPSISESRVASASQSSEPGREVCLSLGSGWDRQVVGINGNVATNSSTSSWENGQHHTSSLKQPRCIEEVPFFPLTSTRAENVSQESPLHSTPILSTKSLFGGFLGRKQGNLSVDIPKMELQKHDVEHEKTRKERPSLDLEAGERFTQESPKQPHWLLQGSATVSKTAVNPLIQSSSWHQPLPFFLQQKEESDSSKLALPPEESGRPVSFQEQLIVGNSRSAIVGLHQHPAFGTVPQVRSPSSQTGVVDQGAYALSHLVAEVKSESIPSTSSWMDEGGSRQIQGGIFMQNYPLRPHVPESQPSVPSQMLFVPGVNRETSRGSFKDSTSHIWYQNNSLSPLVQQQQELINQSGGLHLTGQIPWQVPSPVGLVSMQQQPTGMYARSGLTVDGSTGQDGMARSNNDSSGPLSAYVPTVPSTEASKKRPAELESAVTTANVELTLAPYMNNLDGSKNQKSSYFNEPDTFDNETSCMSQSTPIKEDKWLGACLAGEGHKGNKFASSSNCFSESSCSGSFKTRKGQTIHLQEFNVPNIEDQVEAFSMKSASSEKHLQRLQPGSAQKEITMEEMAGSHFSYTGLVKMKEVSDDHYEYEVCIPGHPKSPGSKQRRNGLENSIDGSKQLLSLHEQVALKVTNKNHALLDFEKNEQNHQVEDMVQYLDGKVDVERMKDVSNCKVKAVGTTENESPFIGTSIVRIGLARKFGDTRVQGYFGDAVATKLECFNRSASQESNSSNCQSQGVMIMSDCNENQPRAKMRIMSTSGELDRSTTMQEEMLFNVKMEAELDSLESLPLPQPDSHDVTDAVHQNMVKYVSDTDQADKSVEIPDNFFDLTNQAAEILLSLASRVSFAPEGEDVEDCVSHTPTSPTLERSLEWFANIIPREDSGTSALAHAAAGLIQLPEPTGGQGSLYQETPTCIEDPVPHAQSDVEDEEQRSKEVRPPEKLDFFESVTLMLKASQLSDNEQCPHVVERWEDTGKRPCIINQRGRSARRGRVGRDFQRETLPSIASLSRQEITEDLQTIGGLLRSSTEVVLRKSSSSLSAKEDGSTSPAAVRSMRNMGGAKAHGGDEVAKNCMEKEGRRSSNGFPPLSSWGDSTRRRRMRRHRSQWSLLPAGIGIPPP